MNVVDLRQTIGISFRELKLRLFQGSQRVFGQALEKFGYRVISHEIIRQLIVRMGKQIEREEAEKRRKPEGKRRVPILYIETEGYWVSMQKRAKSRREVEMNYSP